MGTWSRHLPCLALAAVLAGCDLPESEAARKPAAPAPKAEAQAARPARPATHKVEKEPFKIEVSLKGVLEGADRVEVSLHPEAWVDPRGGLSVVKAVAHGSRVKKGEILVWLDLEKIDQVIRDLEAERQLADLAITQAEEELPVLTRSAPLELAQAERAKKLADEDLKKFLDTDRPLMEESANFNVKLATFFLEYAKEELRQLEKMYRDKDLREETEEIILKRQRQMVEMETFFLKMTEASRDRTLKITLPRREQTLKQDVQKLGLALDKARTSLPLTLSQKRLTLAKMKYERSKSAERLQKLQRDRAALTVKSPADGVAYYGRCVRGKWTTTDAMTTKLRKGGLVAPEEVFITIVPPGPLFVRASIPEKELRYVPAGASARVVAAADPERKLPARVEQVSPVPVTDGTFEARLALEAGKDVPALVAGMDCTVKLTPYVRESALTVPASAVFAEELDDDKHFVYVPHKGGKAEKKPVKVGKTARGKTEILGGLKEGDEILLEKPVPARKTPVASKPMPPAGDKEAE